jgi:nitrogen fixation-related uncharacterized protein
MKALFFVLVLSTVSVLVAVVAMWWRLRQHLHKSDEALKKALQEIAPEIAPEIEPEQEPVER